MGYQENTADLLYKAVRASIVSPTSIDIGDFIVITNDIYDTAGIVKSLTAQGNSTLVKLKTSAGTQTLQVDSTNFIHVIQKAAMLDLRKHNEYERTDDEVDIIAKNDGKHKERPEFGVEDSENSNLPTSKISLSLRKVKEA